MLPISLNVTFIANVDSIRTSAAFGICRFIERSVEKEGFFELIRHIIFPQIKKGLKVGDELVRSEWIKLWGLLVSSHAKADMFTDMVCMMGVDDENNFFSNIIHIQIHRRVKALRMVVDNAGLISPSNVTQIISILSHFVYNSDKTADHNIINEAMASIAACCGVLGWGQYYSTIKRFMTSIKYRPELEKALVRLIVLVLDKFHFQTPSVGDGDVEMAVEDEEETDETDEIIVEVVDPAVSEQTDRIHLAVTSKLIPSLQQLLATKNDETVASRVPLAIAITKLLKQLPEELLHHNLPKLLLTLCNFLSSHLQSSRDCARATLVTISQMLGSSYLSYILNALRIALKRGYQLHVLGYTLHSIISANVTTYAPGSIDSCVPGIVEITMHDIFGETGKEREVLELKGKMREIKSTKSFETLEFLCRIISFVQVQKVLVPLKAQMLESNEIKTVKQIEEVFRRLAVGINANVSIDMVDFMVFVNQLLTESLPLAQADVKNKRSLTLSEKRIQVQLKRSDAVVILKFYEANVHMFVEFGLSLLLTSLKREKISNKTKAHMEMLDPLIQSIGRALYAKHSSITVLAIRILCIIIQYPLPELVDSMPVFVKRMFQLISKSTATDTELIQSVFKLLTIILRDLKHVDVPEKQIITLLEILTPDLEDAEKQGTTFSLIRAIIERKYVTNEVYDMMDRISRILITSQSSQVRELCRNCYIQFLIGYPHGNVRLRKQMGFLVSNLDYEFESGRTSVLELFNLSLTKFSDELFQEYCDMLFLAIVMVLANDDSSKCREMAGLLVKALCNRLDINRMQKPLLLVEKWFKQDNTELQQVSSQVVGLIVDAYGERSKVWIPGWMAYLTNALKKCLGEWRDRQEDMDDMEEDLHLWELGYFALKTFVKISKLFSIIAIVEYPEIWTIISDLLLHPHQWIRLVASQLLGVLFSHIDATSRCLVGKITLDVPQTIPYPLLAEERDLRKLAKRMSNQLDSEFVDPELAKQLVKNLYYIGKSMIPFVDQVVPEDPEDQEDAGATNSHSSLSWLSKKLCFLARTDGAKKRGLVLVNI